MKVRQDRNALEQTHIGVRKSADTVRENWSGVAARAAAATHEALLASILAKRAALESALSACQAYQDAHEDVKDRARVWVEQLAAARQTIGSANAMVTGPLTAPGMGDLIALATRSKTAALAEEAEALARLKTLYMTRVEARAAFRAAISDIIDASAISARVIDKQKPHPQPKPNNSTPWELGQQWLTGTGPRHQEFTDDDPFTMMLREHDHVRAVEDRLRKALKAGTLRVGEIPEDFSYHLGGADGAGKYVADYSTLATGGATGNLAVTFLGSYELHPEVLSINPDGSATVRFVVTNESDIQSATHPPVIGYTDWWSQLIGNPLDSVFKHLGPMAPTSQTITWTEPIRPTK
ncbi:hypothetical protein ACF1AJ_15880 [Leifsonia sp. NPDC014704]|uniref:hypothetical protein n=1 Tax=Leifsonia sp. NPDC014704 TaxID=3364123 RepID=UPI0036F4880C